MMVIRFLSTWYAMSSEMGGQHHVVHLAWSWLNPNYLIVVIIFERCG